MTGRAGLRPSTKACAVRSLAPRPSALNPGGRRDLSPCTNLVLLSSCTETELRVMMALLFSPTIGVRRYGRGAPPPRPGMGRSHELATLFGLGFGSGAGGIAGGGGMARGRVRGRRCREVRAQRRARLAVRLGDQPQRRDQAEVRRECGSDWAAKRLCESPHGERDRRLPAGKQSPKTSCGR